jgi:hypothetical protein
VTEAQAVAVRDLGEAAWTSRDLYPVLLAIRGDRRALAVLVADLREQGLKFREIAERLGISRSYASLLSCDPDGSRERDRKAGYGGQCKDCGAPTDGSNGRDLAPSRCAACSIAHQHDERYWTRDRIVEAFKAAGELLGRAPAVVDWQARMPSVRQKVSARRLEEAEPLQAAMDDGFKFPPPQIVRREFGSWSAARVAAGFDPSPNGGRCSREILTTPSE